MNTETYYKKVGRKYVPMGVIDFPRFEQGNWLVIVHGTCTSYVKVGDGADLPKLATTKRLIEKLVDVAMRKKKPHIMWRMMDKREPTKLTNAQKEANDAFCKAFKVSAVWVDGTSLHGSVEEVVETAIKELGASD